MSFLQNHSMQSDVVGWAPVPNARPGSRTIVVILFFDGSHQLGEIHILFKKISENQSASIELKSGL